MEPNDSILSSYYPQHHHQVQQHQRTTTATTTPTTTTTNTPTTTTTTTTSNGIFSNSPNHHHQVQVLHRQPHYPSSEATPLIFSPHSVTGRAPVSAPLAAESVRRKRGRPRKYGIPESAAAQSTASPSVKRVSSPLPAPPHKKELTSVLSSSKKAQLVALGNAGQGFTPHIINLAAGEDVAQKIMSFVQQRKCAVCIISASGSISNASLRQPAMLGGNVSYEGRFEILSLSGSYVHTETGGGASSKTGGLSVCLAGTDGRIVGGGVGGPLLAAGPVQVIIGSFYIDTTKDVSSDKKVEASSSKLPPQVIEASVTSVSFRPGPDSSGRVPIRGNDDHQNMGGNFMVQSRGMHVQSPRSTDWRGVLDGRNSANIEFTERMDGGSCQSPEDGDNEHLGI